MCFLLSRTWLLISTVVALVLMVGCGSGSDVNFRFNSVEWIKQERLNLEEGKHFPGSYRKEIGDIQTALFGTPDDPHFPFIYEEDDPASEILDLENLRMAAGPVKSDRHGVASGLYREHCVQCHGISGDGRGPTAAFLNPYPRDFRLGKFKFKSTPLRRPPTDEDLTNVIRHGIPGTAMPSFQTLPVDEIESLVDYVKYLTIRGTLERTLIAELDSLDGDPLLDLELISDSSRETIEDDRMQFQEQLATIVEEFLMEDIVHRWSKADDLVTDVPRAPEHFDSAHPEHRSFVESGRQLFRGKANCVQCHGPTGLGDGQNENYDDWTNDWLKTAGVDPNFKDSYQYFLDAGAMKPRHISPRNLQLAVFRGGSRPQDIYRRIANGIEGTPMPSAPTLTSEEIWALVAFVREMRFESLNNSVGLAHPNIRSACKYYEIGSFIESVLEYFVFSGTDFGNERFHNGRNGCGATFVRLVARKFQRVRSGNRSTFLFSSLDLRLLFLADGFVDWLDCLAVLPSKQ